MPILAGKGGFCPQKRVRLKNFNIKPPKGTSYSENMSFDPSYVTIAYCVSAVGVENKASEKKKT